MSKLLIVCQKYTEQDDAVGFFVAWVREFQKHFEHVDVIALHGSKIKIVRWAVLVWRIIWLGRQADAVFCHMSPIFAVFAGLTGKPVYLWYLHRSVNWRLKLAEKMARNIFTASADSLGIKSKKIIAVGHGIDVERFATQREWRSADRILSVGRITPIKNFETLLETGLPVTIVGRPIMPGDEAYLKKLKRYQNATFVGFVPYAKIPAYYQNADIVVNLSPAGGLDKVVFEAMASGCIVIVCNKVFRDDLPSEFFFTHGDAKSLADTIRRVQEKTPDELKKLSDMLVQRVRSHHALSPAVAKIYEYIIRRTTV